MVPRCIDGTAFCEVRGRKLGEGGKMEGERGQRGGKGEREERRGGKD